MSFYPAIDTPSFGNDGDARALRRAAAASGHLLYLHNDDIIGCLCGAVFDGSQRSDQFTTWQHLAAAARLAAGQ